MQLKRKMDIEPANSLRGTGSGAQAGAACPDRRRARRPPRALLRRAVAGARRQKCRVFVGEGLLAAACLAYFPGCPVTGAQRTTRPMAIVHPSAPAKPLRRRALALTAVLFTILGYVLGTASVGRHFTLALPSSLLQRSPLRHKVPDKSSLQTHASSSQLHRHSTSVSAPASAAPTPLEAPPWPPPLECPSWPEVAIAVHTSSAKRLAAAMNAWGPPKGRTYRCVPVAGDGNLNASAAPGVRAVFLTFGTDAAVMGELPALPQLVLKQDTHDAAKTFAAVTALNLRNPAAQWFVKSDDDTLFVLERLAALLLSGQLPPSEAVLAGCQLGNFFSGGAGYIFTRAALHAALPYMSTPQCNEARAANMEDVQAILCVQSALGSALRVLDVPGMWMSLPENAVRWWAHNSAARALAPPISMHHMQPDMMHALVTPAYPARTLHLVWLSRPTPSHACRDAFEAAGWEVRVWHKGNTGARPFWHMYSQLSDDAFDRLVGAWAVLAHGGAWLAAEAVCSSGSPAAMERALARSTTLLSLPEPASLQAAGGPLDLAVLSGQCAVAVGAVRVVVVRKPGLRASASSSEPAEWIIPAFLACSVRADAAARLLKAAAAAVAVAGKAVDDFKRWSPSAILPLRVAIDSQLSASLGRPLWTRTFAVAEGSGSTLVRLPLGTLGVGLPLADQGHPALWEPRRSDCGSGSLGGMSSSNSSASVLKRRAVRGPQRYVTTVLRGGLGNQLFMASAALAYARRTGRCLVLPEGTLNPHRQASWPYSYTIFSRIFTDEWERGPLGEKESVDELQEAESAFNHSVFGESKAQLVRLVGDFQHHAYHFFQRSVLQDVLSAPEELKARLLEQYPGLAHGIAIHVRRGDSSYSGLYPIPSVAYYRLGIDLVMDSYEGNAEPTFFFLRMTGSGCATSFLVHLPSPCRAMWCLLTTKTKLLACT
jgi:hypothetical protein